MKKKVMVVLGVMVLAGSLLAGCGKSSAAQETVTETAAQGAKETEAAVQDEENTEPAVHGRMTGGWAACDSNNSKLTDEEQTIFDDALSKEAGLDYEGIAVIATQVVSGTNRAYLAYGGETGGAKDYAVIVVYSDLQGNNEMKSLAAIDPTDLHIKDASGEKLLGGWEGATTGKAWMLPSEEAQSSFDKLFSTDPENMRNPIALLDTQVVAGVNYLVISMDKEGNIYLSKWYRDLDGNAQIMEDGVIDLEYYTQNHQ